MKQPSTKQPDAKTSGAAVDDPILKEMERRMTIQPDDYDEPEPDDEDATLPRSPLEEVMAYLEDAAIGGSLGPMVSKMPSIIVRDGAGDTLIAQLARLKLCTERVYTIAIEAHQAAKR